MRNRQEPHASYRLHRRQTWAQIILPLVLASLLALGTAVALGLSAFEVGGDVSRWAAISTIWLVIPVLIGGLIVLAILIALIYVTGSVHSAIPPFTRQAQRTAVRIGAATKQVTEVVKDPFLVFRRMGAAMKARLAGRSERT